MSLVTQGIFNLKQAQNASTRVTVFKNHEKRWAQIEADNKKAQYNPGDQMVFNLKGQGVDYMNLNGSQLWMNVEFLVAPGGAYSPTGRFLNGSYDLIYRQQTRSGAFDLEDVLDVNHFMYMQMFGSAYTNTTDFTDRASNTKLGYNADLPEVTSRGGTWVQVPFRTILDAGGYVSVYMLAESLELRWTLNTPIRSMYDTVNANGTYVVHDAYLLADGLVATSGGQLEQGPQKWATHAIVGFKDQVSSLALNANSSFSHDVKKTSLKKWCGAFFDEIGQNIDDLQTTNDRMLVNQLNDNAVNDNTASAISTFAVDPLLGIRQLGARKNPLTQNLQSLTFSMGGIQYPYINGMQNKQFMWMELQRYFHHLDNSLNSMTPTLLQYEHTWYSPTPNNTAPFLSAGNPIQVSLCVARQGFFTANFDRLDQRNEVISGIDTERYDVVVQLNDYCLLTTPQGLTGAVETPPNDFLGTTKEFNSFYIYDVIVTMLGGEIKIED